MAIYNLPQSLDSVATIANFDIGDGYPSMARYYITLRGQAYPVDQNDHQVHAINVIIDCSAQYPSTGNPCVSIDIGTFYNGINSTSLGYIRLDPRSDFIGTTVQVGMIGDTVFINRNGERLITVTETGCTGTYNQVIVELPSEDVSLQPIISSFEQDDNFLWERNRLAGTSGVGFDYTDYVQDESVMEIRADDDTTVLLDESNIMTAESKEAFDPTGVTMPINSIVITTTIDTAYVPDGSSEEAILEAEYAAIKALFPLGSVFKTYVGFNITDDFGFAHRILQYGSDYTVDKVIYNRGVDTFEIQGSTYGAELNRIFNKGIYEPSGATLQTRATRVFTDLGLAATDYDVTALDNVTSQMPVPVVTAREALTMIGSAAKCHLEVESDGVITYVKNPGQGTWNTRFTDLGGGVIGFAFAGLPFFSTADGERPTKYTIPEDLYLGEPEEVNDDMVFRAFGNRYTASVAASAETILETTTLTFTVAQGSAETFVLTHEAVDPSTTTVTVTGATLNAGATLKHSYTTYVNVTRTSPTNTFTVKIDAKKLDITSKVATTYTIAGITTGQELTYDNPIYTSDSMLSEVVTNIATITNRAMITIPMRDDPKLFVGDSVMLSGMFVDRNYRYTLTEAKRTFDGALRAEYTFV